MKLEYRKYGDYLISNICLPPSPQIGRYGELRYQYLRKHKEPLFTALLMKDKLNSHLEESDRSAQEMYDCMINRLKEQYGITEKLQRRRR